jgi:hypothetical protein
VGDRRGADNARSAEVRRASAGVSRRIDAEFTASKADAGLTASRRS